MLSIKIIFQLLSKRKLCHLFQWKQDMAKTSCACLECQSAHAVVAFEGQFM